MPEDRIFPFLKLTTNNLDPSLLPDRGKSAYGVYTENVQSLVSHNHLIKIPPFAGIGWTSRADLLNLPSQVPDWTNVLVVPLSRRDPAPYCS